MKNQKILTELQYIQNESEWILQSVRKIRRLLNGKNIKVSKEKMVLLKVYAHEITNISKRGFSCFPYHKNRVGLV